MLVAVGPKPIRRFNAKGQVLLPVAGETPPARLYFRREATGVNKGGWETFNVAFNSSPAFRSITADKTLLLYRKNSASGSLEKYVTIPPGAMRGRRIFFLIPSTAGVKLWGRPPLVRRINLDSKKLQRKQFIFKNLSGFTVQHMFDDSVATLQPMKIISYQGNKLEKLYRLNAYYGRYKKVIYNTALKPAIGGGISLFVLYNAWPDTNAGRRVGAFKMMIPVRGEVP